MKIHPKHILNSPNRSKTLKVQAHCSDPLTATVVAVLERQLWYQPWCDLLHFPQQAVAGTDGAISHHYCVTSPVVWVISCHGMQSNSFISTTWNNWMDLIEMSGIFAFALNSFVLYTASDLLMTVRKYNLTATKMLTEACGTTSQYTSFCTMLVVCLVFYTVERFIKWSWGKKAAVRTCQLKMGLNKHCTSWSKNGDKIRR